MINSTPKVLWPYDLDSEQTLFQVYNNTQSILASALDANATKINIVPALDAEVWPENGFATLPGELIYYEIVEKNHNNKIIALKKCNRAVEGVAKNYSVGTPIYGMVVAQHHNQLAEAIIEIEKAIGGLTDVMMPMNIPDARPLHATMNYLLNDPGASDDICPDVQFEFNIGVPIPGGASAEYCLRIFPYNSTTTSFTINFGDGSSTTTQLQGVHQFTAGGPYTPTATVTTSQCLLVIQPSTPDAGTDIIPSVTNVSVPFQIIIPDIPDFPTFIAPRNICPGPLMNLPPMILPNVTLCSQVSMSCISTQTFIISIVGSSLPSAISLVGCSLPSFISFATCNIPSFVSFACCTIPSVISFAAPPSFTTTISFTASPSFTPISFAPVPSFAVISFAPVPSFAVISFAPISFVGLPSVISIACCTLPSVISIACCTLPSVISIACCTLPSVISIACCTLPSVISFGPVPTFSMISFGPVPTFSMISFGPVPSFAPIPFGPVPSFATISFGPVPTFSTISFGPAPTISVSWGIPPTISVSCIVSVVCPGSGGMGMPLDQNDNDSIPIDMNLGIPEEIRIIAPQIPDINVIHNLPNKILVEAGTNFPSVIHLEGMPDTLQVTGIPATIEVVGIPKFIQLVMPENPTIELVYKGAPLELGLHPNLEKLLSQIMVVK